MLWIQTGSSAAQYVLFLEFTYTPCFNVPLFLQPTPYLSTSSQNSVLLYDNYVNVLKQSFLICKEEAAALLRLVVVLEMHQFAVPDGSRVLLEISRIEHQFHPVFPQSARVLCVFS
jgi:hypothetical protein